MTLSSFTERSLRSLLRSYSDEETEDSDGSAELLEKLDKKDD